MPIYVYHCANCGQDVEAWLRTTQDTPVCPECDQVLENKLLTAASFVMTNAGRPAGKTCCGRDERCAEPSCSTESGCMLH